MTENTPKSPLPFNVAEVKELIELLKSSKLGEIEMAEGDKRIRLQAQAPAAPAMPAMMMAAGAAPVAASTSMLAAAPAVSADAFKSPMVGTFYTAPGPDEAPFVSVGSNVKKGQVVCIIEAMKTFNKIEADRSGTLKELLVKDGQPVEYGQPLMVIA